MNHTEFEKLCKRAVVNYANKHLATPVTEDDVTFDKMHTMQQDREMYAGVILPGGLHYSVTYNAATKEIRVNGIKRLDDAIFALPDGDINNIKLP